MTDKKFLDKAYNLDTVDKTRAFYQQWAETYDAEIIENGYATPDRCATALARFAPDKMAPILDVGCGTGISGLALAKAGFTKFDGSDLSAGMLAKARDRKGLYRKLWQANLNDPFPFAIGTYHHITAMGVIAVGHAPPSIIEVILDKLLPAGLLVFSLNDHTLEDPSFEETIDGTVKTGRAKILFTEYGDHLPGIGLKSKVYVLRKI